MKLSFRMKILVFILFIYTTFSDCSLKSNTNLKKEIILSKKDFIKHEPNKKYESGFIQMLTNLRNMNKIKLKNNLTSKTANLAKAKSQIKQIPNYLSDYTPVSYVRYVEIFPGDSNSYVQLSQVVVRDEFGNNISKGKLAYGNGGWGTIASTAVDGHEGARPFPNVFHSNAGQSWGVDLGEDLNVSQIDLWNRSDDCCKDRIYNLTVKLLDSNKNVVFTFSPTSYISDLITLYTSFLPPSVILTTGVRYIKVLAGSDYLNFSQILVRNENGINILNGRVRSITTSGDFPGTSPNTVMNDIEKARAFPDIWCSSEKQNGWYLIDLGYSVNVSQVEIFNRASYDCEECAKKIIGSKVQLLDTNANLIYQWMIHNSNSRIPLNRVKRITERVRYVELMVPNNYLNFSQLVIRNEFGINIAVGKSATSSPDPMNTYLISTVLDGVESARNNPYIYHSCCMAKTYFTLDLGKENSIDSIEIYNRLDCCQDRIIGTVVTLYDSDRNIRFQFSPINDSSLRLELSVEIPHPIINSLINPIINSPLSPTQASEGAYCRNGDGGFKFPGLCSDQFFKNDYSATVPAAIDFIYNTFNKIPNNPLVCFGDFQSSSFSGSGERKCDSIPLMDGFNYGVMAAKVDNVMCGSPVTVAGCAVFDRCGTVAISLNSGLAKCSSNYSRGIATLVSPLAFTMDNMTFGMSINRRFTKTFTIAYRDGDMVNTRSITTYGHFMVELGNRYQLIDIKIAGNSLNEIISLDLEVSYTVDFGNALTTVQSIYNSVLNTNSSLGTELVTSILNTNSEMTISGHTNLTFKLIKLTNGFLPDLNFNLEQNSILISTGINGNASGMNRGIYAYFKTNLGKGDAISNQLVVNFNKIMAQFNNILQVIGISTISLPNSNFGMGIFIQDDSLGFEVLEIDHEIGCFFVLGQKKGACKFDGHHFTAVIQQNEWIIHAATKFFLDSGVEVLRFSNEGKFVQNSEKAMNDYFINDSRNFLKRIGKTMEMFFNNDVRKGILKTNDNIKNAFNGKPLW